jgi:hypothetical protein
MCSSVEMIPWTATLDHDYQKSKTGRYDLCIVKLKALPDIALWPQNPAIDLGPPPPRPIPMSSIRPTASKTVIIASFGCSHGGPIKYSEGEITRSPPQQDLFRPEGQHIGSEDIHKPQFNTTLEGFPGNSGGPVVKIIGDYDSVELIGVHVSGQANCNWQRPPAIIADVRAILSEEQSERITDDLLRMFSINRGLIVNDDRKSATFVKVTDKSCRTKERANGKLVCRIDSRPFLFKHLLDTTGPAFKGAQKFERTSFIALHLLYKNPKYDVTATNDEITITIAGLKTVPQVPKVIKNCIIGRYGGTPKDLEDFKEYLGGYVESTNTSSKDFLTEFDETKKDAYESFGSWGKNAVPAPGLLDLLTPGSIPVVVGGVDDFIKGQVTIVFRIKSNFYDSGKSHSESFVFVGKLQPDSKGVSVSMPAKLARC